MLDSASRETDPGYGRDCHRTVGGTSTSSTVVMKKKHWWSR